MLCIATMRSPTLWRSHQQLQVEHLSNCSKCASRHMDPQTNQANGVNPMCMRRKHAQLLPGRGTAGAMNISLISSVSTHDMLQHGVCTPKRMHCMHHSHART